MSVEGLRSIFYVCVNLLERKAVHLRAEVPKAQLYIPACIRVSCPANRTELERIRLRNRTEQQII